MAIPQNNKSMQVDDKLLKIVISSSQTGSSDIYPSFEPNWDLSLHDGEKILWLGFAKFIVRRTNDGGKWRLPKSKVIITSERIVYLCQKYKKGSFWFGIGPLGLFLAILFMSLSSLMAFLDRRHKAAVGQVNYEWPYKVVDESYNTSLGYSSVSLLLMRVNKTTSLIRFYFPRKECSKIAKLLASNIGNSRIENAIKENREESLLETLKENVSENFLHGVEKRERNKKFIIYETIDDALFVPLLRKNFIPSKSDVKS